MGSRCSPDSGGTVFTGANRAATSGPGPAMRARAAWSVRERGRQFHALPYVRGLRKRRGGGNLVPWFDPDLAGVNARILTLVEAPGPRAAASVRAKAGSGIVSRDNNDEAAANFSTLTAAAGWSRSMYVSWNVVPWYIGDDKTIRPAERADIEEALQNSAGC